MTHRLDELRLANLCPACGERAPAKGRFAVIMRTTFGQEDPRRENVCEPCFASSVLELCPGTGEHGYPGKHGNFAHCGDCDDRKGINPRSLTFRRHWRSRCLTVAPGVST